MVHPTARCAIVPPYLIARLVEHPDERVSTSARTTLREDVALRAAGRAGLRATASVRAAAPAGERVAAAGPHRTIDDAQHATTLPGRPVRREGEPAVSDVAVNEAYDGLGDTWALYQQVYGRDSLDGAGLPLLATVHYGSDYDNAFWNGAQMVFGDGDGKVFIRFTVALDVIGHELTHGVTQYTAKLDYQGQSGALNESVSDVFGSLVKQKALGQSAAQADWLIGAGLFTAQVQGQALRSMKAPGTAYDDDVLGKDPQPATMAGYVDTSEDNGGVHVNSGIPNHAFYLAATGIGGNAWDGAGWVWYDVLTGPDIAADCDFARFAALTVAAATARFGADSTASRAVASAWQQVGVESGGAGPARPSGPSGASGAEPRPPFGRQPVRVIRSGGIAGLRREREVVIPDDVDDRDGAAWMELLASTFLGALDATPSLPDGFVYRVTAPQSGLDVTAAEQQLPPDVRGLFDRTLRL